MTNDTPSIKNILMTADTLGGVWYYSLELIGGLASYGIHVHLATMGKKLSEVQQKEAESIANLTIHESSYKLEWMDNPWTEVEAAGQWLLKLEKKIKPDLIHLNGYAHASLPWKAPVIVVCHSCVLTWWEAVKKEAAPAEWKMYESMVKAGLLAADRVVGISYTQLNAMERIYGAFAKKEVIYNGIQAGDYRTREKLPFVFSMGRIWDEAKNLRALGNAARELNWKVVIAGDNKHPVSHMPLRIPNVIMPGLMPHSAARLCLSQAAIYALPARYEPFGLSVLEAALSGCALVLSDIPTFRELWEGAALFVPADDEVALAETINLLSEYKGLREHYAEAAKLRALEYSSERMSFQYFTLYTELLQEKRQQSTKGKVKEKNTTAAGKAAAATISKALATGLEAQPIAK